MKQKFTNKETASLPNKSILSNGGFKHVSYLWDEAKALALSEDEVGLLVYRSNLLGADLRLTNFGGGNTSCKTMAKDPLTGEQTEVMWVKGSGGDLGTMKRNGLAALYVDRLRNLKHVYRGIEFEDEMVELFNHCMFELASKGHSVDTPLHGFLPFKHIDHLHPDAAIAIAASKDGKHITQELFNGTIGWVDWQRPGFDLGLKLKECLDENPGIRGIMLGSHGLFTWGDTAYQSYLNTLEVIERCAQYLENNLYKNGAAFGDAKIQSLPKAKRLQKAAVLALILRGLYSQDEKNGEQKSQMIGHFSDDERVLEYINSKDLERLAPMGTSCPDHFLRIKISPLVLNLNTNEDFNKVADVKNKISILFKEYREMYEAYYDAFKHPNSPAMRDANPVVILYPGIGMFTFARDKQTARVAAEFYINAISVMKGAEAISEYISLPRQEAFNIEYWLLEEAKLQRMPKPKALSGKIALITGSAGGIGKAIAKKFMDEGACVIINDNDTDRLQKATEEVSKTYSKDSFASVLLDVTSSEQIRKAFEFSSLAFGGVDIIVNSAGISISKPIEEHTEKDWDFLYDILVKGQFLVTRSAVDI